VVWAALWDFMQAYREKGIAAWEEFAQQRRDNPYPIPSVGPDGEGAARQQMLEERYFDRGKSGV
jgi:hypothetical protein